MCAFSDGSTRWDWRNHFLQMPAIIWSFSDYSTPASFGTSTEVNLVTCSHLQAFVAVLILENFRGCVWKWLMVQHWIHKLCWLVVWNMNFMTFHRLGMSSSQLTHIFQRGRAKNHQPTCHSCQSLSPCLDRQVAVQHMLTILQELKVPFVLP